MKTSTTNSMLAAQSTSTQQQATCSYPSTHLNQAEFEHMLLEEALREAEERFCSSYDLPYNRLLHSERTEPMSSTP